MYTDKIEQFLVEEMQLGKDPGNFTSEIMFRVSREVIERWREWKRRHDSETDT